MPKQKISMSINKYRKASIYKYLFTLLKKFMFYCKSYFLKGRNDRKNRLKYHFSLMGLISAVVFFGLAEGANTATINAASCSYADISAAVAAASAGDTVLIPAGTCIWGASDHLNIAKQISIIGAGVSEPNITKIVHDVLDDDSSATPATFNINITADVPVRISGIYFDKVSNISGTSYPYYYREAIHIGGSHNNSYTLTKIRIDNNYFHKGDHSIFSSGFVYGVIDSNTFLNPDVAIYIGGDDSYAWGRTIAAGTANAFFVEGNIFILDNNYGTGQSDEMIYPQQGARVVVRYNTYNASLYSRNDTPPLCTSHPNWGGSAPYYEAYRGQPIYEVYNNDISLASSYNTMITFRGGSEIIHNNIITKSKPNTQEYITDFTEEEGWTIGGLWCYPYWISNTNYSLGDKRQPQHYNGYYYQVTADNGVSGSTEPDWPAAVNSTVNDGGLTWTNMGAAPCPKITTWPANDQVTNSFIWNNYINGISNNSVNFRMTTSNGNGYDNIIIQKDRDYFLHEPQSNGRKTYYVTNAQCLVFGSPAACCAGAGAGNCSVGHYDALAFTSSGPNAYYPYAPYACPHSLTESTRICDSSKAGTLGYNVFVFDTTPPAAPSGLTVQ